MTPIEIMAYVVRKILVDSDMYCREPILPGYFGAKSPCIINAEQYTHLRITSIDVTVIARYHSNRRTTMFCIGTIAASDPEFVDRLVEAVRQAEHKGEAMIV